jgi:hypothetical protein
MDICIEMVISYMFLFVAFIIDLGDAHNMCAETRCGRHGPPIRFPFRLNSQPHYCGYSGFNLSCTDTNLTVLELPVSVKLLVEKINYKSQVIQLYDPQHCFPRPQLQWLNLSNSSPFRFEVHDPYNDLSDYALFNCSPRSESKYRLISCLSGPTYQVYPATYITASLVSCTKIYNLYQIPVALIAVDHDKFVQLSWSTPDCKRCEVKGKKCEKSNSSRSGTQCIPTHTKGILSIQFISTFLHVRCFSTGGFPTNCWKLRQEIIIHMLTHEISYIWRAAFKRTQHQTLFTSFSTLVKYCFLCFNCSISSSKFYLF